MEEAFYTNSYPADKDANKCLVKGICLTSMIIGGADTYVIYTLINHLYTYVMTIHREPDEVLIACSVYILGLVLRAVLAALGYHFATNHTDRTPENFKGIFSFLHVVLGYNFLVGIAAHKFFGYHIHKVEEAYGTAGMNRETHGTIHCFMKMIMI